MRTFLVFIALFMLAALISGLLSYPVWVLVNLFVDQPMHRVMGRVGMVVLAALTVVCLRRNGLANKATLGYGIPRRQFLLQMLLGLALGVLLLLPLTAALFALGLRTLPAGFPGSGSQAALLCKLVGAGLVSGLAVAFIEETFCRGALFSVIERESGVLLAVVLPSLLYAATHYMDGKLRIPADQVTYASGLQAVFALFERFATPGRYVDSFLALTLLGILLALVRLRTGAIALGIGLHAGGAAVIWVVSGLSVATEAAPLAWLAGSYRGMIGWLAGTWFGVIAFAYWWATRRAPTKSDRMKLDRTEAPYGFS
jgi:uncharacterized protein